ncbi:MAG: FlgD immunoglobulin-like domain containing protein [Candidatus Krumholzibacteriia bacterium]
MIAAFEADQTGRARASYSTAHIVQYTDDSANVWAHEMGHSFGSCDEYVEGGQCNGGINCGPCQSSYLDYIVNNDNCQLATCPVDVACLMINNTFSGFCDATLKHWAWWDGNSDGQLDKVKRRVSGGSFASIYELWHNGWFSWNNTGHGMAIHQRWDSWCVIGLRSPSDTDYDLRVYAENNHNRLLATSTYGGAAVDFVVGDYNHSRTGNEHIEVVKYSGASSNYNVTFESGTGVLYPDGVVRTMNWLDYNVVRAYDVPLFGGERVTFRVVGLSAGMDMGMALYRSNGDTYFAGRSSHVASADAGGVGGNESFTYDVPADDVYGLVVWSNSTVNGSFDIQIGPTPYTLAEESPFLSAFDLRLFNYDPNANYWSVIASRTHSPTDSDIYLFADASYTQALESSTNYASGVEFIAVDYNHATRNRDHFRVVKDAGTDSHRNEWEHDADILTTFSDTWGSTHVARVWDVYIPGGENWFFRQYQEATAALDAGIYVMRSQGGDNYVRRGDFAAASNFRAPSAGGEWMNYVAPASDWYGVVMIDNVGSEGAYSFWAGPDIGMADDQLVTRNNEVVWAQASVQAGYWTVFGVRSTPGDLASVWLYGDDAYTLTTLAVSDQNVNGVAMVVGDYNHVPTGTVYPRFRRNSGSGYLDCEWEGGTDVLDTTPGSFVELEWPAGDVVEAYDVYLASGQNLTLRATDLSGTLDLGLKLFRSSGAPYHATGAQAVVTADAGSIGGAEDLSYTAPAADWYGLVLYCKNDGGGRYRLQVIDPALVAVDDRSTTFGLRATTANPFTGAVTLQYSLSRGGPAQVDIYDVAGRRVRTLLNDSRDIGTGVLVWDGRTESGAEAPGGVYLARLTAGGLQTITKLVRVE